MYLGLKKELEEIVDQIRIGDGVVIELTPDSAEGKRIGYVYAKTHKHLQLRRGRNPHYTSVEFINWYCAVNTPYSSIENIKVVDPEKTE